LLAVVRDVTARRPPRAAGAGKRKPPRGRFSVDAAHASGLRHVHCLSISASRCGGRCPS